MARVRIEFKLSMPNPPSWNGKWSGEERNYTIVRDMKLDKAKSILAKRSFRHRWEDGWCACIDVRAMLPGERKKSNGFCGYDWMVENIMTYGQTRKPIVEESVRES